MSKRRTPCWYGIKCYDKDPSHLSEYSHPQEPSDSDDDDTSPRHKIRTPCRYGIKCYDKDPSHLSEYSHPQELSDSDDDDSSLAMKYEHHADMVSGAMTKTHLI